MRDVSIEITEPAIPTSPYAATNGGTRSRKFRLDPQEVAVVIHRVRESYERGGVAAKRAKQLEERLPLFVEGRKAWLADESTELMAQAACLTDSRVSKTDMTPFYEPDLENEKETNEARREREALAKQICDTCPRATRSVCLFRAVEGNDQHGIWAGTTRTDRVRLRRALRELEYPLPNTDLSYGTDDELEAA